MKAVQELVSYFDRRGKLSSRQIRKLLDGGFLAADAPANMVELCDEIGATFYFRICGSAGGPVWGTDIYAGDSALAAAVVHAWSSPARPPLSRSRWCRRSRNITAPRETE
jgi:hypothetical protein